MITIIINDKLREVVRLLVALLVALHASLFTSSAKGFYGYTNERPLTIVCDWDFRPFEFVDNNGQPSGYNVEVLDLLLNRLEIPHRFVMLEWDEAVRVFKIREADLINALAFEYRMRPYVMTQKYVNYYQLSAIRKATTPKLPKLQQLDERTTIGLRKGDYAAMEIEAMDTIPFKLRYLPPREGLLGVSTGACTYYIWGEEPMKQKIKELALTGFVFDSTELPDGELRLIGYDKDLIDIIDDEFTRMEQEGDLQKVQDKWFHPERLQEDASPLTVAIFTVLGVLLLVVLLLGALIHLRVKAAVSRNTELKNMMEQALHMGDYYVLEYDIQTGMVRNAYGNLLPPEGMSREELISHIEPTERDDFQERLNLVVRGESDEQSFRKRYNRGTDENPDWGEYDGTVILERENGEPRYIFHAFKDITRQVQEEAHNKEMAALYMKVFQTNLSAMSFYGSDGRLIDFNQKMYDLCQMNDGTEHYFREGNLFDDPFMQAYAEQGKRDVYHCCGRMYYPELGIDKYIESRVQPVFNDEGQFVYHVVTVRDVTAERDMYMRQRAHDRQLEATNQRITMYEQQLRYLLEESKMWVWYFDLQELHITFQRTLRHAEIEVGFEDYKASLAEESRQALLQKMKQNAEKRLPFHAVYEMLHTPLSDSHAWHSVSGIPLHEADGSVRRYFGIVRDITDLLAAQERLRQETARAQDSGRMKAAFLANMTHEIRTPLNAIVGFSDLLQVIEEPEERQEFIRIIRNNCDMLLRLINDILEASNMSQTLAIHPEEINLPTVFDDICQTLAQRVQEPGVEFLKDNPADNYTAVLDKGRLQQMLTNFVTNAVKYTHKGHIKVGWHEEAGGLYFYCEDTGAGIPKDKQASVFERFVKLNDFVQGTGLGLSICKAIIDRCNGQIGVTSEGEGQGSTFWFWIPRELEVTE